MQGGQDAAGEVAGQITGALRLAASPRGPLLVSVSFT